MDTAIFLLGSFVGPFSFVVIAQGSGATSSETAIGITGLTAAGSSVAFWSWLLLVHLPKKDARDKEREDGYLKALVAKDVLLSEKDKNHSDERTAMLNAFSAELKAGRESALANEKNNSDAFLSALGRIEQSFESMLDRQDQQYKSHNEALMRVIQERKSP